MSTVAERTLVAITVEGDCTGSPECSALAQKLFDQLASGRYTYGASVIQIPASIEEWDSDHRTARKRAAACLRDGYMFLEIDRHLFADDVWEINRSAPERQGRPMADGYHDRPTYSPLPVYPCDRHAVHTYGVLDHYGKLRAYTWVYRCGDLVMFSMILGHAQHLERHVMYLLIRGALDAQAGGGGVGFYNLDSSGTDGLRFFKHRCGFLPADLDWRLS